MAVTQFSAASTPPHKSSGAALLMAMMIVALVSTIASAMVWQQWRAVQVEAAERARTQSQWLLTAALDWARLILREDAKGEGPDHLGEPWAVPLAEARLSTFLAADKNNTDVDLEAFLSGSITDAHSRYNLRNLVNKEGAVDPKELLVAQTLFEHINVSRELATVIAKGLESAIPTVAAPQGASGPTLNPLPPPAKDNPLVLPHSVQQLAWFGLEPQTLRRLEPFVVLLPVQTQVNLNTASREVLASVVDGLDLASAERLIQTRRRSPFNNLDDAQKEIAGALVLAPERVGVRSSFFETRGRIRLESRVLELRTIVQRSGSGRDARVEPIFRELVSSTEIP